MVYLCGSDYKQTTARAHWRRPRRYARTQALWKRRERTASAPDLPMYTIIVLWHFSRVEIPVPRRAQRSLPKDKGTISHGKQRETPVDG